MTQLSGRERSGYVRRMFGRIAGRYDTMNRLMTFGQDSRWRKEALGHLDVRPHALCVDIGTGTGDIAFAMLQSAENVRVVASDLTPEMIAVGKQRPGAEQVLWLVADAEHMPFDESVFDGVISGFLLRNVGDLERTLAEQRRLLKPDGNWVSLDTSPPRRNILAPFLRFHLNVIIPLLGRFIAGDAEAYRYLPDSTASFLEAEQLAARLRACRFENVGFVRRMLGTVAIHWGRKRNRQSH